VSYVLLATSRQVCVHMHACMHACRACAVAGQVGEACRTPGVHSNGPRPSITCSNGLLENSFTASTAGAAAAVGASVAVAAAEGDVADAVVILARPVGGCWVATLSSAADLCGTEQVCSGCGRAQAARARLRCTTLVGVLEARRQDEAAVSITTTERSAASARALGEVGGGKGRSSAAPN
jgi:hypothetical protein